MTLETLIASNDAIVSRKDAASVLGCDPRKVSQAIRAGQIPCVLIGGRFYILRVPFVEMLLGRNKEVTHGS